MATQDVSTGEALGVQDLPYAPLYTIFLPSVAAIGTILNIIIIGVFSKKLLSSSCTYYFRFLAVTDIIFLVMLVLLHTPQYIFLTSSEDRSEEAAFIPSMYVHISPASEIIRALLCVISVLIMIDHYVFEYKARRFLSWTTTSNAQKTIFTCLGVIIVLHIPSIFKLQTKLTANIRFTKVCVSTLFLLNTIQMYDKYIYPVLFTFLPMALILALCVAVAVRMCLGFTGPSEDGPHTFFRAGRSTLTTICISLVQFLCTVPYAAAVIIHMRRQPDSYDLLPCSDFMGDIRLDDISDSMEAACIVTACINSGFKFFIYLAAHRQFRKTICRPCRCCKPSPGKKPKTKPSTRERWRRLNHMRLLAIKNSRPTGEGADGDQKGEGEQLDMVALGTQPAALENAGRARGPYQPYSPQLPTTSTPRATERQPYFPQGYALRIAPDAWQDTGTAANAAHSPAPSDGGLPQKEDVRGAPWEDGVVV